MEASHVEREVEDVVEDDETEVDGCIHLQFFSTLRVTRNEGIVIKIRQLILMKVSPIQNVFGRLYLQEMHTTTLLVETYPEGDEIGEPMEEDDIFLDLARSTPDQTKDSIFRSQREIQHRSDSSLNEEEALQESPRNFRSTKELPPGSQFNNISLCLHFFSTPKSLEIVTGG
ncbi:hypothetical protein M431DRAFT_4898 [Trichoderma harzianum CBS 226.95]|uniref:Uncharacterized protein n=1 Tax=Trichoderma harzianum CBS 226.95 TaxID=983964 RepID=A0A2T4AFX7_TRIHA|nr:hypothetical protein M431DRAFT_4898 [Trichoderma harzianum CBS 226.95]PTB55977.1 hypothetical protein M431DRAFT_4898 [Trichoderma harzianum CBS 226.95]